MKKPGRRPPPHVKIPEKAMSVFQHRRNNLAGAEKEQVQEELRSFGQQVQVDWRIARLKTVGIGERDSE